MTVHGTSIDPQQLEDCRVVWLRCYTPSAHHDNATAGHCAGKRLGALIQLQQGERTSNTLPFVVGSLLAENLHPVANPVVDRQGTIYTTISGTKGQQVPVSLYRVTRFGEVEPFAEGILNPTGLAFGPDGELYVSSRHEGTVYRVDRRGKRVPVREKSWHCYWSGL